MKLSLLLFSFCFFLLAPASANWQRSVTNYSRRDYKAGNQNWMITQHPNGWIYFANNKGLVEYDGVSWNTYSIHNAKTRAVKVGTDGRIYVGGLGQFGYFVPNRLGGLDYVCLSGHIDKRTVGNIWNIHVVDNRVYFQGDTSVFYLENSKVTQVKCTEGVSFSAVVYNKFYAASSGGILVLNGDEFTLLPHTEAATHSKTVGILPFNGQVLIVTSRDGLFLYDGKVLTKFSSAADAFLEANQLFCAAMRGTLLALGSVQDGVLLLDTKQDRMEHVSITNGLQNKTVLSLEFDQERNLWLGLDNGIDCIHLNSPLFFLYSNKSAIGAGYASCNYQGKLYLGTNQGLYVTDNPVELNRKGSVNLVPGAEGQVWSVMEYDNKLFCGGGNSLIVIDGNTVSQLEGIRGVWAVRKLSQHPDVLLAGTYWGLFILKKENGRWQVGSRIEGANVSAKTMYVEEGSNVAWVANKESGLFRLTLSDDLQEVRKMKCYNSEALPAGNNVCVTKVNHEIVVASRQGLFRYNQIKDCLEEYTWLESQLEGKVPYTYLTQDAYNDIWYVNGGRLKVLRYDVAAKNFYKNKNESYLDEFLIEDFEQISLCDDKQAVIGTEEGFSLLQFRRKAHKESPLTLQIRKVYLTGKKDSLVYGRNFTYDERPLVIPYANNSLRIEYSVNNYDKSQTAFYSFKLKGTSDEPWSAYSTNYTKEFTDLKEGVYTFYVKIVTDRDKEPVITSFAFEILPPWYRTWWANALYLIAVALFFCYVYYRIHQSRKQLIQQKELELYRQRQEFIEESDLKDRKIDSLQEENLQSELRHKSEELIRTTLNIVRKNEILQEIKREAVSISHSISDENLVSIRRKTLRLISQIDTNIEHDDDLQAFQNTFDFVHQNFFKVLDHRFPELTNKEKMLCAYIKMNLMSKEIAPLLNISVRGVEIGRYRLRKKLELGEKDNLAEFLQRLSK